MAVDDDKERVVYRKGEYVRRVGNATVKVVVPTDISIDMFSKAFAPIVSEKRRLETAHMTT